MLVRRTNGSVVIQKTFSIPLSLDPLTNDPVLVGQEIRNQLAKTITVRFAGVDIAQVLSELSERSGVRFEIEPGALQRVPADVRNVQLILDNSSITQALETIAGFTGLGYVVTPRGVYIWNQSYATPGGVRDRVVGTMTLPDSGMQVFIFLIVMAGLLYFTKKKVWHAVELQKLEPRPPTEYPRG